MFTWLVSLLKPVSDLGSQYMANRAAVSQAEHQVKVSILGAKARLAEGAQSHNNSKELRTLEKASPWVRWVITFHVLALFDVGILYPDRALIVYENLEAMPVWVVGLFVTVFGFYFAVTKITDAGAGMLHRWKSKEEITK